MLPQQTLILHDTIRENIACGRPGASDHDIVQAARAAAHDFITGLPHGYDTPIDPHTAQLSGGQLQRIAIARAMLRDAPVLVLDEPTTGLDAVAARRILTPLRRLMAGRTTILITHDVNLAPDAVLDHGHLTESGTHTHLLTQQGTYALLHHSHSDTPNTPNLATRPIPPWNQERPPTPRPAAPLLPAGPPRAPGQPSPVPPAFPAPTSPDTPRA
ncbi:ABC-type multidrug transport system fused ATPase/permease subunit [Streptomyces sp. V4I23]|nr:ABC-type multidrug transport system fused ATPase/permease subunit [Streptomyces sp. V4I23]